MTIYMLDKSAMASHLGPASWARIQTLVVRGQIAVCEMTMLEILHSAESPGEWRSARSDLNAYRLIGTTGRCWERAIEVQGLLADRGGHRRALPDYIIAATAEVHGATVLHNDEDFEIIAKVTGQKVERV